MKPIPNRQPPPPFLSALKRYEAGDKGPHLGPWSGRSKPRPTNICRAIHPCKVQETDRQLHICELPPSARASRSKGACTFAFLGGRHWTGSIGRTCANQCEKTHFWAKGRRGVGGGADTHHLHHCRQHHQRPCQAAAAVISEVVGRGGHTEAELTLSSSSLSSSSSSKSLSSSPSPAPRLHPTLTARSFGPREVDSRRKGWGRQVPSEAAQQQPE